MSQFRISLGRASCENIKKTDVLNFKVCEIVQDKVANLKKMDYSNLAKLSDEQTVEHTVNDKVVVLTVFKKAIDSDKILLVAQAAYQTFKFPNYISFGFIGKILVDGIVVNNKSEFSVPEDNLLWEFK